MATTLTPDTIDGATTLELRAAVRGPVLTPGDPGYEAARHVRNGLIDRRPRFIVRCTGTADVVACVNFAREHGLLLSVRGGAHNVAGNATNDGGLVIDLSGLRAVAVDPATQTVWAQGGATWGDVDHESQLFGLAVPGGVVSTTGIGGLTLHGGYGHVRRRFGLSLDSLLEVEIVTADGAVRTASATEHPDLFWAVRGAGSNFGVVTAMRFQAYPVGPQVYLSASFYPPDDGQILRAWRSFTSDAPDEIGSLLLLWSIPNHLEFPEELHGQPTILVAAVHCGDLEAGERATRPLRELGDPLLDLSGPAPYTAIQSAFDPLFPEGRHYYWKSVYIDDLSDDAIAALMTIGRQRPSPTTSVTFWQLGGAMSRVPDSATAYARRDAPYLLATEASWDDPAADGAHIAWARDAVREMGAYSAGGAYLNFPGFGEERETLLRASYGENYERLRDLKTRYDPGNLFRMNLNIPPRTSAS